MTDTPKPSSLGGRSEYRYERPEAAMLESFSNTHPDAPWVVALECGEFTSLCPVTGKPDFGRIHVVYVPGELCVESKSLKLYLGAYRNHGAFHEDCVNRIADDLVTAIAPRYLQVFGDFNARGGIAIRPMAVRKAPDLPAAEERDCLSLIDQHDSISRRI
jgi:7-cyano-7-deazaguanine reductase